MIAHRKKTNEVNKESFGIKINNLNLKNKKENDTVAVAKNEISPYKKENEVKVTDFIADQKYLSNISVLNQNIEEFKNMEENLMAIERKLQKVFPQQYLFPKTDTKNLMGLDLAFLKRNKNVTLYE